MRLRKFLPLVALAPALLLAGCNGDDDDSPQPTPTSPTSAVATNPPGNQTPAPEPTATPGAFAGSTDAVEAPPPGGLQTATLVAIRAAAHEGYDRLVYEFAGNQVPGYSVKYGTSAIACGSGQDVTSFVGDGKAPAGLLLVTMKPSAAHDDSGQATVLRTLHPGLVSLIHIFRTCDFEADVTYAIATQGRVPLKVTTLSNPPRLVIDVSSTP